MASTYLQRTESAGSRKKFTWSAWIKRSKLGASQFLAACSHSSSDEAYFFFNGSDSLIWQSSSASYGDLRTNRVFRDTNAWYNIILAVDTTQSTAADRIKFYVNGVQETSFSNASYPNQDTQVYWNVGGSYYPRIGRRHAASDYFDGLMSHVAHIDGTQELPTIFGETDSTTGEWKIKTSITPSSGWGTNGYHILKDGNSVTDQSGQGNNWTVQGGTLTKTEDCPSNVFNNFNKNLGNNLTPGFTFSNGNNTLAFATPANDSWGYSNFGAFSGKYYAEFKATAFSAHTHYIGVKFVDSDLTIGNFNNTIILRFAKSGNANAIYSGFTSGFLQENLTSLSAGDIIGVACDIGNGTVQFYVNGATYGNQVTGQASNFSGKEMQFIVFGEGHGSQSGRTFTINANFGNGYFGSTVISSEGTNASGNGIFEYDVPSGFTALSTKGLNL